MVIKVDISKEVKNVVKKAKKEKYEHKYRKKNSIDIFADTSYFWFIKNEKIKKDIYKFCGYYIFNLFLLDYLTLINKYFQKKYNLPKIISNDFSDEEKIIKIKKEIKNTKFENDYLFKWIDKEMLPKLNEISRKLDIFTPNQVNNLALIKDLLIMPLEKNEYLNTVLIYDILYKLEDLLKEKGLIHEAGLTLIKKGENILIYDKSSSTAVSQIKHDNGFQHKEIKPELIKKTISIRSQLPSTIHEEIETWT